MLFQLEDIISGEAMNIYGVKKEVDKTYFLVHVKGNLKERKNSWCWVDAGYYIPIG